MRHIWADVKRAVFSRSFLLAALGMALCLAIGGFQDLYRLFRMDWPEALYGYHEELFLRCLEGELVLFAVPILSAVPYTSAFVEDVKSGYLKPYLTRTTVDRYVWGKSLGAALSGGLALAAGMALALFLFWLLCAPVEVYGEWAVPSKLPEIGLRLILFFLSGALWATVGLLFSGLTQNVYLAYASPFILYYVLIILQERYFRDAFMLNPQNYLTMHGAWPLEGRSAALTLLSLVILFQLLFFLTAQNELRDDKRQRRAFSSLNPRPPRIPKRDFRPRKGFGPVRELRQVLAVVRYNFRPSSCASCCPTRRRPSPTTWARPCRPSSPSCGPSATPTPSCSSPSCWCCCSWTCPFWGRGCPTIWCACGGGPGPGGSWST